MITFSNLFFICQKTSQTADFYRLLGYQICKTKENQITLEQPSAPKLLLHPSLSPKHLQEYPFLTDFSSRGGAILTWSCQNLEELLAKLECSFPDCTIKKPHQTKWGSRVALVQDPDGRILDLKEED